MTVSVNGAELFYSTRGQGRPCLVLSAVGTDPYERMTLAPLDERVTLVYVDLRGGGRSTGDPTTLTFDQLAGDLEAIRMDLGVDRVAVLGHSVLGVLAIEYGRRRPASVSHVITVGTPPTGDMTDLVARSTAFFDADASPARKQRLRDNMAALPADATMGQTMLAQTPVRFYDATLDAAPLFAGSISRPALLQHVLQTLTPSWDIRVDSGGLTVPILLAHGRYDYTVPHTLWDGIPSTLPAATFHLFQKSGHQPFFEEPARFAGVLSDWMVAQDRPTTGSV